LFRAEDAMGKPNQHKPNRHKPNRQAPLTLNQKVAAWAQGQRGKKVGRGECWDLGEQALKHAGALTSNDLGEVKDDTDYVWGDSINVKDVQSGDILQLRDHVVTTTTVTKHTFKDGSWEEETKTETAVRPHHTAIVNGKLDADGAVKTLEQHVKPRGEVVQDKKLFTRDVPAVQTKKTERRTNPNTKKVETAEVTRTVTITVSGTIWAYRPKSKP
jgi:hypothetical protein